MLSVAESTLSRAVRRHGIVVKRTGDRDRAVPAADVLRLNQAFRRKIVEELAGELVAYAEKREPLFVDAILAEVTAGLDALSVPGRDGNDFLDEIRGALPERWYREVERIYHTTITGPIAMVDVNGGDDEDAQEAEESPAPASVAG